MKNIANSFRKIRSTALALFGLLTLGGCLDGDETTTGQIEAYDQIVSQNRLVATSATIGQRGWLTVSPSETSGEPLDSILLASPVILGSAGSYFEIPIQLTNMQYVTDTMKVWMTLHEDSGVEGLYEYDGSNDLDRPISINGFSIRQSVTLYAPRIVVSDQSVEDQTITVEEAVVGTPGWAVAFAASEQGSITNILGRTPLDAGIHDDITVELDASMLPEAGDQVIVLLHVNEEPYDDFDYPGSDDFETFGSGPRPYIGDTLVVQE